MLFIIIAIARRSRNSKKARVLFLGSTDSPKKAVEHADKQKESNKFVLSVSIYRATEGELLSLRKLVDSDKPEGTLVYHHDNEGCWHYDSEFLEQSRMCVPN
jgi:hypothetical protein